MTELLLLSAGAVGALLGWWVPTASRVLGARSIRFRWASWACAGILAVCWMVVIWRWGTRPEAVIVGALGFGGLIASLTDLSQREIFNRVALVLAALGVTWRWLHDDVTGALASGVGLFGLVLIYALVVERLGREGPGGGDIKLYGALGAWFGSGMVDLGSPMPAAIVFLIVANFAHLLSAPVLARLGREQGAGAPAAPAMCLTAFGLVVSL